MEIPPDFEFSQGSLQDYSDCRRRFLLRYLQHIAWPAVQAEPALENERHIQRGERFHRLVQQCLVGVPPERLVEMAAADPDEHVSLWWRNFTTSIQPELTGEFFAELTLAAPIASLRLIARYDLVLVKSDGQIIIYDWKTNLTRPKRTWLSRRLQTLVYPYLLTCAGSFIKNNKPIDPARISMVYWFAEFPNQPEEFYYSPEKLKGDRRTLIKLIEEIHALPPSQFELTSHLERCQFCVYRSLCSRGVSAGPLSSSDADPEPDSTLDLSLDLDQISEIQF